MLTPKEMDAIKKRHKNATPDRWSVSSEEKIDEGVFKFSIISYHGVPRDSHFQRYFIGNLVVPVNKEMGEYLGTTTVSPSKRQILNNVKFIGDAYEDVAALLQHIAELETQIVEMETELDNVQCEMKEGR